MAENMFLCSFYWNYKLKHNKRPSTLLWSIAITKLSRYAFKIYHQSIEVTTTSCDSSMCWSVCRTHIVKHTWFIEMASCICIYEAFVNEIHNSNIESWEHFSDFIPSILLIVCHFNLHHANKNQSWLNIRQQFHETYARVYFFPYMPTFILK